MKANQKGFAHLGLIIIFILVLGFIGFAGYRVIDKKEPATNNAEQTADQSPKTEEVKVEENEIPEGFVEYENKDLGFKFAYPGEWGQVSVADNAEGKKIKFEAGDRYNLSFSQNPKLFVSAITSDFKYLVGKDGSSCTPTDGFARTTKPTDLKPYEQREDGTTVVNKMIIDEDKLFIAETFEYVAESSYAIGWCPGLNLYGYKTFDKGQRLPGLSFAWYQDGDDCCNYEMVTKKDAEAYKNDGISALAAKERENIISTAKSIKEL